MTRRLAFLAVVTAILTTMPAAFAATQWTRSGSGNGTAKATSVGTGNLVTAPSTSTGSVSLSWTANRIGGNDISSYSVTRYPSTASTVGTGGTTITCPTSITSHTVSCSYTESTSGTYKYTETPQVSGWRGGESAFSGNTTVTLTTYTFAISTIATQTAGTAFGGFTVQLKGNGTNTGTFNGSAFTGAHTVTFGGTAMSAAPDGTAASPTSTSLTFNSSGLATVPAGTLTLYKAASSASLTVTDSADSIAGSASFAVNSGGAQLSFSTTPSTLSANGATWTSTVTIAHDSFGNAPLYAGTGITITVTLASSAHFSIKAGATGSSTAVLSANVSATATPSGQFTVEHIDAATGKSTTLTASSTATGFTSSNNATPITISS